MKALFTAILSLMSGYMVAQTYPDETTLENDWEQWQDKVPVSGNVRVGLMINQTEKDFNPAEFYVMIPETKVSNLCVELSSKDGRYSANINYNISTLTSGMQQFILPTKYKSELKQYNANEVVILATLNDDCNNNPQLYLLSCWKLNVNADSVSVFVNSSVPTSIVFIKEDKTEIVYNCETLEFPKVAYNKKCQIPIKELEMATELVVKSRIGRGSRTSFKFHKMPLKLVKL